MKVSLNIVRQLTNIDIKTSELVEIIGEQLGAVEEVIELGARYDGIVIAKIIDCQPLPNSDHLNVCLVDDGGVTKHVPRNEHGLVQVLCGAPNVQSGQFVAWITPGTKLPTTKSSDTIDAKEIRGVLSQGMLASPRELGISDNHDGILEIKEPVKPGQAFKTLYDLDDTIIEIENKMFTRRPDCFGQIGVAREIAGITHHQFSSPAWYIDLPKHQPESKDLPLRIDNQLPKLVPRFMAQVISGVKVGPSPLQMQSYLSRLGVRPINNVVDQTNYFMLLTAQPMHAYDYDKLVALDNGVQPATLVVRHPRANEQLTLLNGKTITPGSDAIVIASSSGAVGLGGVMGGKSTEVDSTTTNLVLECASFDMYSIRRTAMSNGLFTDAVTRFNKGQSPLQNDRVLAKTAEAIVDSTGGNLLSRYDDKNQLPKLDELSVERDFVNERLGSSLSSSEMAKLLTNVEFEVAVKPSDKLAITAPFWRTDIAIPEDIVEEVGRLFGYARLPLKLPKRDLTPASQDPLAALRTRVRDLLAKAGANEVLTYSFVHGNLLEKVKQDQKLAYKLANALSPDVQFYRLSLLPSLLEKVHPNLKAGFGEFALFEMNKVHIKSENDQAEGHLPAEFYRLALVFALDDKAAKETYSGAPYYLGVKYLDYLLGSLGINYELGPFDHPPARLSGQQATRPFEAARTGVVKVSGQAIGLVGEPAQNVKIKLKLPKNTAMFELDLDLLLKLASPHDNYQKLSHYPRVEQDICFRLAHTVDYQTLYSLIKHEINKAVSDSGFFSLTPVDIYQSTKDSQSKQITLHLNLSSYQKTLTTEEVNQLIKGVAEVAQAKLSAQLI